MTSARVTVQVGVIRTRQYEVTGHAQHHIVVGPPWVTRCTGHVASRQYTGYLTAVTCRACLACLKRP